MNEKDLIQLYKTLEQRAQIDRPTYLTNYQMFQSFILNIKDDRFFNRKQYRIASEEEYVKEAHQNRFIFEELINFWYLTTIIYGAKHEDFGKLNKLTHNERERLTQIINWILQGQLTKHRDRINSIIQKKYTGRVDVLSISNDLLEVNADADKKIITKLDEINNKIKTGMADDLLLRTLIEVERDYWGYFQNIEQFKKLYFEFMEKVKELFSRQIFLGYKSKVKDHNYTLPVVCRELFLDYLFHLGLDVAFLSPKKFHSRLEKLKKLYEPMMNEMITFFENEASEDIGPIDVNLIMAPAITFQKNLEIHLQQYKKKYNSHLNHGSKTRIDYEKEWIRMLYKSIREDCIAQNIHVKKEALAILYSIMNHIEKVFDEFHKVCKTNFKRAKYSVENLGLMTRGV